MVHYLLGDHLGSTSVVTATNGGLAARQSYYPFGSPRPQVASALPTDRRFTGQRSEEDTLGSLYDFVARPYSPALGRFLAPDSIIPEPGNPQALNRYSYTNNNPLRYIDPSGHAWIDASEGAGVYGTGSWAGALASAARTGQEYSTIRALLVTVASVVSEPIDWISTAHQCLTAGCNPALAALGFLPFVPGSVTTKLDDVGDATRLLVQSDNGQAAKALSEYDIVPYGTKATGFQKHHGILDKWAKENNLENYSTLGSPTILLTEANHNLTRGVFNNWKYQNFGSVTAKVDWTQVSSSQIQALAEQMLDAAKVPSEARQQFYREFAQFLYEGKWE